MKKVYILLAHNQSLPVGIFSSLKKAEQAKTRACSLDPSLAANPWVLAIVSQEVL